MVLLTVIYRVGLLADVVVEVCDADGEEHADGDAHEELRDEEDDDRAIVRIVLRVLAGAGALVRRKTQIILFCVRKENKNIAVVHRKTMKQLRKNTVIKKMLQLLRKKYN